MDYYVYVKFLQDDVKKVTNARNVKGFRPTDVHDFNAGKTYNVFWEGDEKTRGGYYDAKLLYMTGEKN